MSRFTPRKYGRGIRRAVHGVFGLAAVVLAATPAVAGDISVDAAVARIENDAANGHRIEVYMDISNAGPTDRLYAVRSGLTRETMLSIGGAMHAVMKDHGSMEDGEARHLQAAALEVRTGEVASLQQDGAHIMLNNPSRLPADGSTFPITLFFENAGKITVEVTMKSADLASRPIE